MNGNDNKNHNESRGPIHDGNKSRRQRMHDYIKHVMGMTYHHVSRGASKVSSMIGLMRGKSHEGKGYNHNHAHKRHNDDGSHKH